MPASAPDTTRSIAAVLQQDRQGPDLFPEQLPVLAPPGKEGGKDFRHGQFGKRPGGGQGFLLRLFR